MSKTLELFSLEGKVAVVTGGAGLLGEQFVETLICAGALVVVVDINEAKLDALRAKFSGDLAEKLWCVCQDVSSKAEVEALSLEILGKYSTVDILINNVGLDPKADKENKDLLSHSFEDYPLELWRQSIETNLTAPFLCSQILGRIMAENKQGVVVNVASTYGLVAPNQSLYQKDGEQGQELFKPVAYTVAKAGLMQLTRYLAAYWKDRNIRVNSLVPHGVANNQDSDFIKRFAELSPLGRMADKEEMNAALLFLASDASSYMTGTSLVVDGGWTAW